MRLSKPLFLLLLLLLPTLLHAEASAPEYYVVRDVLNGKSFTLDSGDTVRMASLQVPNVQETTGKKRAGEPLGEESKAQLKALIFGKKVRLLTSKTPRDRKNRIVAQVYLESGGWVQEAMLQSGYAMVYPIFEDSKKTDLLKMLEAESAARTAKKGLWAHPDYQPLSADAAGCCIDRFRIVRGVPLAVEARRGNVYLNFGKDWKTDFTAFIPKRYARSFAHAGIEDLTGKSIELRGWISEQGGPMIELMRPEQLQILP